MCNYLIIQELKYFTVPLKPYFGDGLKEKWIESIHVSLETVCKWVGSIQLPGAYAGPLLIELSHLKDLWSPGLAENRSRDQETTPIRGLNRLNLRALLTTVTEERPMAPAAKMGFNKMPKKGNRMPAATGMRMVL